MKKLRKHPSKNTSILQEDTRASRKQKVLYRFFICHCKVDTTPVYRAFEHLTPTKQHLKNSLFSFCASILI